MNKFFLVHRKNSQVPFDCNPAKRHLNLHEAMSEAQRLCIKEKSEFEILEVQLVGVYKPNIIVNAEYIDSLV